MSALQKKLAGNAEGVSGGLRRHRRAAGAALLQKGFIVATPFERLQHFPRYLKAASLRLDKARADAGRDARLMADWQAPGQTLGA